MGLFEGLAKPRQNLSAWLKALRPIGHWTIPPSVTPAQKTSIGGSVSAMSPKEIHSLVLERAKHGALIEQRGRTVYYIAMSVAVVCSILPIPSMFFPREYVTVTALGFVIVPGLLAWAILAWLKRRLLTDEEMSRQSLSAWLKEPAPPVTPARKNSD